MGGLQLIMIGMGAVLLLCSIVGIVYTVVMYKQKHKVASMVMLGIALFGLIISACVFPLKVEEHTELMVIQDVGSSFTDYNAAYCESNGEIKQISIGEYNRNMFSLLKGIEVEITYGKLHTLIGPENWHFIDITVPELTNALS